MPLFKKKESTKEAKTKLNFMTKMARKRLLDSARADIKRSYEQGRIVFQGDAIEYMDREGEKAIYRIDELSAIFWDKFETQLTSSGLTSQASLLLFDITPDDVKKIILNIEQEATR